MPSRDEETLASAFAVVLCMILFTLVVGARAARGQGLDLRLGATGSSGLGETGAQPWVALDLPITRGDWVVIPKISARSADKVDGGDGWAGSAQIRIGYKAGDWGLGFGYRYSRLDVERYEIDAHAPEVALAWFKDDMVLLSEVSLPDSTPRETWSAGMLLKWRWLWAGARHVDFGGLEDGPGGNGYSYGFGYRYSR